MTTTSTKGLVEIASHEGLVTSRYKDSVGVWTIGVGHTAAAGGVDPAKVTRELSVPEVMEIFAQDIPKYEAGVRKAFKRPLTQEQFDAAVSFHFNTGAIGRASWVRKFNAGDMAGAKKAFMSWSKPSEIIPRRRKERDLFFNGKYSSGGMVNVYPAVNGRVQWSKGRRVNAEALIAQKPADVPKRPGGPIVPKKPSTQPVSQPEGKGGLLGAIMRLIASWGKK